MEEVIEKSIKCPVCKITITYNPNYVEWCQECEWNLKQNPTLSARGYRPSALVHKKNKQKPIFFKVLVN